MTSDCSLKRSLTLGHRYKITKAKARPAITERSKKPSSDPADDFLSEAWVLPWFIRSFFRQIDFKAGFLEKPVLMVTILSANRLSRMACFVKIRDWSERGMEWLLRMLQADHCFMLALTIRI